MNLEKIVTAANGLIRETGNFLRNEITKVRATDIENKQVHDFVTYVDKTAEKKLVEGLSRILPEAGFLTEEKTTNQTEKPLRWIIDPLDGTTNFMRGNPHFAISIGVERDGNLHAGVIYDVIRDEMFFAEVGKGAFLVDGRGVEKRLRIPQRDDLTICTIATGAPFRGKPGHAKFLTELHKVMAQTAGIRRNGSAALDLAWLAAGRFDGFWERRLNAWDIAAGVVIVREAGGIVHDLDTGADEVLESGNLLCASEKLLPKLEKLLT